MAAVLLLLPACDMASPDSRKAPSEQTAANSSASALEALAEESGVIGEEAAVDPVGSYGRSYDGGEDRLCLLPAADAGESYAFGVEIHIGEEEHCRGKGRAKRTGDLLILNFSGGRCTITAHYEGDRVVMPGAVDQGCASLCSARGSLAGVSFPRVGLDAAAARSVAGDDGKALCGG